MPRFSVNSCCRFESRRKWKHLPKLKIENEWNSQTHPKTPSNKNDLPQQDFPPRIPKICKTPPWISIGYRLLRMHESYEHVLIDLEVIRGSGFTRFGPPPWDQHSTAQQRKPAALPNRHASMRNSREFDAWGKAFHFCLNLCILTANCKHRSIFPYSTSRTRFQMRLYFQIKVRTFTTPPNGKGFNWKLHKHVACGSKFWTSWEIRNPRLTLGVGRSGQILNNSHLPHFPPWGDLDVGSSWPKTSPAWPQGVMVFSCFWGNHTRWLLNLFRLPRSPGPYWRERWHNQQWPLSDPEWHGGNATTWVEYWLCLA